MVLPEEELVQTSAETLGNFSTFKHLGMESSTLTGPETGNFFTQVILLHLEDEHD